MAENILKELPIKPASNFIKRTIIGIIVIALFIWALDGLNYKGLMDTAQGTFLAMIRGILNPDMDYLTNYTIDGLPYAILETIAIAISGTFVSGILAIPFALLASENIVGKRISRIGKIIITMIRTFPEIILALIFISVVGPGAPAGILALGIHSIGMLGKLFSESIESMDIGVKEAVESCGGNNSEILFRAVIPQVAPEFLSYTLFRFEINMRAASTLGLVGAGGIGAPLIFAIRNRNWERTSLIVFVLIITVSIIDIISSRIRKKLV
ncbi:phosphonate ABC transporter, permease protein PhnE [Candidatus Izimaplasma bacterium ZiA1]|uniref:phosphonate ABC transporter, permease protein PhnE n=1 Tax=Candidatus Izimoplasma sp. ZiA1 TaxID=2024899 RepID=UPI000BAA4F66|nr:phosphonate ABC transporter, permease protein PhnE [Candidatus Izimaplasma bacterium ZiA1]